MKKTILFATLLTSGFGFSQSLTQLNEPVIGDFKTMYMCDSLTPNLEGTTGAGVTWDYSNVVGIWGETRDLEIIDPATTDSAIHFTASTKAMRVQNSLINYFNSTTTERQSQGFLYQEPNFGNVLATFGTDNQMTMTYPFANGDYFSDAFSGSLAFSFNGLPQNPTCTGISHSWIDGQGTLMLPGAVNVSNVMRYKIVDTVFTTVDFIGIPLDVEFIRTQFEYYDGIATLPFFMHTSIVIQQVGSTDPLLAQTIVLSAEVPTAFLGVNTTDAVDFSIFPNPTEGKITFKGEFSADASVTIYDQSGRVVAQSSSVFNGASIDLSSLNKGIYQAVVLNNGNSTTQSVVLR